MDQLYLQILHIVMLIALLFMLIEYRKIRAYVRQCNPIILDLYQEYLKSDPYFVDPLTDEPRTVPSANRRSRTEPPEGGDDGAARGDHPQV
jgi:hypothetical protein